ncbi:armadillo repeat-containing protein 3 [Aplochiton taeniatus]
MGKKVKKESEVPSKDAFDPLPIESKKAATVVLMLNSPEEEVLAKACEAIYKYAEKGDENRNCLVALGAVKPLSHLISHDDKLVRRNAFMALGVMAANGDVKNVLKKLDVIPSIISKLSPEEDVIVHEFATLCLVSLSVDFNCKVQVFDHEGLEPLIQLLSSPDPDVKKNSVETIFNLVQDLPSRMAVRELNGLRPLLDLLRSEFPVIQQLALRTLESITTDSDTRVTFREEQGFERLLEFLNNKDFSDLHVEALQVLANFVEDCKSLQRIHEAGGLTRLVQFILTPTLPEVQTNAVKAISRVAQSSENRKLLHEQNIEKALVELLAVENDSVRTATCLAVAAMSLNLASKDTFRDLDGIPAMVQLLNSESSALKEAAAQALSNLTHNNHPNAYAVYAAEGDEPLVQQLQDGCPGAVAHAAAALTNMADQEHLRCSILSHGVMHALVEPLQSTDKHTLVCATQALAVLACDAEGRADLRNAGGLAPLVNLLRSHHTVVRRNACWAISVCANDEPTAVEMCRLGALELLQEINSSVNRRNKFSETAFQRLLDFNLSFKYSLTGRLSSIDITTDGFYDSGPARPGQKVLILADLAKQPVNQRRPVICVNIKTPETISVDQSEERQQDSPTETRTASVLSNKGGSRTPIKGKSKGRKEDEKPRDDDDIKLTPDAVATEKPWVLLYDTAFHGLVNVATTSIIHAMHDDREQYIALARLVSEAMGGAVEKDKLHEFQWELHVSELKFELQSNIIPVGRIQKGTYYHRALLFKLLADYIGLRCSLVRGEYNRAWNEVLLSSGTPSTPGCPPQPLAYLVDLMHQPGNLLRANTPAAIHYQTI